MWFEFDIVKRKASSSRLDRLQSEQSLKAYVCVENECVARPALFAQIEVTLIALGLVPRAIKTTLFIFHVEESVTAFLTLDLTVVFFGNVALIATFDPFVAFNALISHMVEKVTFIVFARFTFIVCWLDAGHGWIELGLYGQGEALVSVDAS